MNSLYFNLTLLLSLSALSSTYAMEMPPQNNKRKAPDSEIELPQEKKSKSQIRVSPEACCPICQEDAQKISTANPNNIAATACCKEFMCKECFDTLHDATKEISKIKDNPEDRANFVDTYNFEPHKLSELHCPLCKEEDFDITPAQLENFNEILTAISDGNAKKVKQLLRSGTDSNSIAEDGRSGLHIASENGYSKIVKWLLRKGAKTNSTDNNQKISSPLHLASAKGHSTIVKMLLQNGANVNELNLNEKAPLHLASINDHVEIVKKLLQKGALVNGAEGDEEPLRTPLHFACHAGHLEIVDMLLKSGADINAHDRNGDDELTPLDAAIGSDSDEKIQAEIVKLLLSNETIYTHDGYRGTPLHTAVINQKPLIVQTLLKFKIDPNEADSTARIPLHYAAELGNCSIISELLAYNSLINTQDQEGSTALHAAFVCDNAHAAGLLLQNNADLYLKNNAGFSPFELMKRDSNIRTKIINGLKH